MLLPSKYVLEPFVLPMLCYTLSCLPQCDSTNSYYLQCEILVQLQMQQHGLRRICKVQVLHVGKCGCACL